MLETNESREDGKVSSNPSDSWFSIVMRDMVWFAEE